ncbi:subtilisin-like serine protease PR1C [Drechmeria coniospora]|uniref:Subtilisin-like serine protease PR1C n=1 Tax=Drechmeria coniospora TaxID=98403 RepID=A0A151GIA5_DRECN|nr:subtilisin-like serine protease PR1C [Drechmeria coniospora]KYK56818.1 subtilisin-like serine protease PR1C [Drechmeria coniospora]
MVRQSILSLVAIVSTALATIPSTDVLPGGIIIELNDGHDLDAFVDDISKIGKVRIKFDCEIYKGVSVELYDIAAAAATTAKITAGAAVKAVSQIRQIAAAKPSVEWTGNKKTKKGSSELRKRGNATSTADTYSPHVMTQIDKLRAKGLTGKDIRIAIIDSGIDYNHPALGGCFGPGCLVAFGKDFVGDDYDGTNTPVPDDDPLDTCHGHGTHVAGIIAARPNNVGFTGVVPDATLGAYRVRSCKAHGGSDIIIAACIEAYKDHAKIINLSIGDQGGWLGEAVTVIVQRIVDKGIPVIASAGNDGDHGLFYPSTPSSGIGVASVASFENTLTTRVLYKSHYTIDTGRKLNFGYRPGVPNTWNGVSLDVYLYATRKNASTDDMTSKMTNGTTKHDACGTLPDSTPDLRNTIVLVGPDSCNPITKIKHALAKGANYILAHDIESNIGLVNLTALTGVLACGVVSKATGDSWTKAILQGKRVTLNMVDDNLDQMLETTPNHNTGGAVSTFSSWGPSWELGSKPQFGAPGGSIVSTFLTSAGGYSVLSGTSMAAPLVTGIVALIGQARGTFDPALINSLLSSTAKPQLFNDGDKFYDYYAPTAQQGGGLVQAFDAAYATTLLQPSALSFNDTEHFVKSRKITITNTGREEITYKLSHVPAIAMYTLGKGSISAAKFPNEPVRAAATIKLSQSSVKLGAGKSASIDVQATPPSGVDRKRLAFWSGWIAINGTDGASLSIPYQGLTGSLRASTILAPGNTWIARSNDTKNRDRLGDNSTFTMPTRDGKNITGAVLPSIITEFNLGTSLVVAHVVPVASNLAKNTTINFRNLTTDVGDFNSIGRPYGFWFTYVSRHIKLHPWDGRLDSGKYAPAGKYKIIVRALRIFGNATDEADWDVVETPPFNIKYPD